MKVAIFDSGALINLSMNGFLYILEKLKKDFDGKFLITDDVKYETIDRPIKIERFELGALRVKKLLDSGVLEMPSSMGIDHNLVRKRTEDFMNEANHFLQKSNKWIKIVSEGEMSCLALSEELTKKGVDNLIVIDERTTRTLSEKPENLGQIMSNKLHQKVYLATNNFSTFSKFRFIRSPELVYVAYKKGILEISGPKALEASLYATKFKGSAISFDEIKVLKKM